MILGQKVYKTSSATSPTYFINLHKQLACTRLAVCVLEINESKSMLQPVESDASPGRQLVFHKSFVFDFEPMSDGDIST